MNKYWRTMLKLTDSSGFKIFVNVQRAFLVKPARDLARHTDQYGRSVLDTIDGSILMFRKDFSVFVQETPDQIKRLLDEA